MGFRLSWSSFGVWPFSRSGSRGPPGPSESVWGRRAGWWGIWDLSSGQVPFHSVRTVHLASIQQWSAVPLVLVFLSLCCREIRRPQDGVDQQVAALKGTLVRACGSDAPIALATDVPGLPGSTVQVGSWTAVPASGPALAPVYKLSRKTLTIAVPWATSRLLFDVESLIR